ncbi:MAG: glycosyltransferase [Kiritimatiellia bacterium]
MSNKRPSIALWFRYGAAEHSELFHALPGCIRELSKHCEVHYFGLKTRKTIPNEIREHAIIHEMPFRVNRGSSSDKMVKTILWILCLPFVGIYCRAKGMRAVYIDETIPFTALIARIFAGPNVALTVADFFVDIYFTGPADFIGKAIRRLDLWSWKFARLIFTRAKSTKTYLASKGIRPEHIVPVYDPCDMNVYRRLNRNECKAAMGYKPDDIVLVHHGILHPNKGNAAIIQAISEMRIRYPSLRYLLIGDGPEMKNLTTQVEEMNVKDICRLAGWLPSPADVNRALNAGDIGLVMRTGAQSDDFHMTGALVHNMACGLPILAARLGGVSEVVEENRNGLLFDPRNMDEFKQKLAKFIEDAELRNHCGLEAEKDARIHFDMDSVIRQTVEPLAKLAGAI